MALDEDSSGIPTPFPFGATGPLTGSNSDHSAYLALVQAVFYTVAQIGDIDVTVNYSPVTPTAQVKYKSRTKTIEGTPYVVTDDSNWTDYSYQFLPDEEPLLGWGENPVFNTTVDQQAAENYRKRVPVDQVVNESQWSFVSDANNIAGATLRSISYEGVSVGVKADVQ